MASLAESIINAQHSNHHALITSW